MAFTQVCRTTDVAPGQVKAFTVGTRRIVLANQGGTFFAMQDLCTHDNGPLGDGELDEDEIECPRHGARFDIRTGKVMALPALRPIQTFPVRVEEGEVLVSLE